MPTKIVTQVGCEPRSEDCGNCGLVYLAFGGAPQGCQRYCCACPEGKRCPACLDAEEAYQVLFAAAGPVQTAQGTCAPWCKHMTACEGEHFNWRCYDGEKDWKFCPHCGWHLGEGGISSSREPGRVGAETLKVVGRMEVAAARFKDGLMGNFICDLRAALAADGVTLPAQGGSGEQPTEKDGG